MPAKAGLKHVQMNRLESIADLKEEEFDILIIGGGATGLGAAVDAASRGYKVGLLEGDDFAKGTSSKSTKLAHGGVRYLQNGDISLVIEALRERGLLCQNAPHLVKNLGFVIPSYDWWNSPFYGVGLKIYDLMAGRLGLGPSELISKEEVLQKIPNVETQGLRGGVLYHDGQFDDARLAISLARTAESNGASLANYCRVEGLIKENGHVIGVRAIDTIGASKFDVYAKAVINCTGVFADDILQMDNPEAKPSIRPSQGVHIVLDKSFLPGNEAIMVPHTTDGRVLFAVPWHDVVVVGTTDTPLNERSNDPVATEEEIAFILENAGHYMAKKPTKKDILSTFAGLRPLAAGGEQGSTKEVSRHHKVLVSPTGLISVLGGKWTTYRKMGEDAIDNAIIVGGLPPRKCQTENLPIHGFETKPDWDDPLHVYGIYRKKIRKRIKRREERSLSDKFELYPAMIRWAVRKEMAMTLEDMLSRRHRALLFNAEETMRIAPEVASIMAQHLGKDEDWIKDQLEKFNTLAQTYVASKNN
jgi:glycerol-3-phosphate dehydrogenase